MQESDYSLARGAFKIHVSDRLTWTGILYLAIKFPLGVASFVMGVTLIAVTGALLTAPFFYGRADMNWSVWTIDTQWEALLRSAIQPEPRKRRRRLDAMQLGNRGDAVRESMDRGRSRLWLDESCIGDDG